MATRSQRAAAIRVALDPDAMWSDDPMMILRELAGSAQTTLDRLKETQPERSAARGFGKLWYVNLWYWRIVSNRLEERIVPMAAASQGNCPDYQHKEPT